MGGGKPQADAAFVRPYDLNLFFHLSLSLSGHIDCNLASIFHISLGILQTINFSACG